MRRGIRFPEISHRPNGLVVEELGRSERDQLQELVPAKIDLFRRAYTRQLEVPSGPLSSGLIASLYTPEKRTRPTLKRIDRVVDGNEGCSGAYYIVRSPDDPNRLDGMLSIAGGYFLNTETGEELEWSYIFDILADPPHRLIGSALLHTAASFGGRKPYECRLDGFRGSGVNNWYERLGFENVGKSGGRDFGKFEIPTDLFAVRSMEVVIDSLEAMHPELRTRAAIDQV